MAEKRLIYIDLLRVLSSVMVIATHVVMHYINCFPVCSIPWGMLETAKGITQFAVPVFFMISGAMILSGKREESYSSFLKRRFSKIALPFLSWSVIYFLFFVLVKDKFELDLLVFFKALFTQDISGHFWFMYTILVLYLFLPFFKRLVSVLDEKQLLLLIGALFAFSSLLPFVNGLMSRAVGFEIAIPEFSKQAAYFGYMLTGYWLHTTALLKKKWFAQILPIAGAAALVLMSVLTWFESQKKIDQFYLNITYPLVVIFSIAVMGCVKLWIGDKKIRGVVIVSLGKLSFTAYLVHMLWLRGMQIFIPQSFIKELSAVQALPYLLGEFAVGLAGSFLVAWACSKIKYVNRIF